MAKTSTGAWFVYIVQCVDGTLYTGITTELVRRTRQHNAGTAARYTRSRRPVTLVYSEPQRDQSTALKREAAIKKLARRQKMSLIRFPSPRSLVT
jgi:predicted GIY-YIG superfamily endonuclease